MVSPPPPASVHVTTGRPFVVTGLDGPVTVTVGSACAATVVSAANGPVPALSTDATDQSYVLPSVNAPDGNTTVPLADGFVTGELDHVMPVASQYEYAPAPIFCLN